jgi:hypothetical protein
MNRELIGCRCCWPQSADEAWQLRLALERRTELIDESHFHVLILACKTCSQRFLSVFFESIDWENGDDPQAWTLMPLTAGEESQLLRGSESLEESMVLSIGIDRRSLWHDHPKGGSAVSSWGRGILVRRHD